MNTANEQMNSPRVIPDRLQTPFRRLLGSWEVLLFAVAVLIFIANSLASPYFLNAWNLSDATFNFTEKAMIAFAMALLIIAGEIDLFEALAHARQHYPIDPDRLVVRGFSMGGAAVWQFGAHFSSMWAAVQPGAGLERLHPHGLIPRLRRVDDVQEPSHSVERFAGVLVWHVVVFGLIGRDKGLVGRRLVRG